MPVRVVLIEEDGRRRLSAGSALGRLAGDVTLVATATDPAAEAETAAGEADVILLGWQRDGATVAEDVHRLRAQGDAAILVLSEGESTADLARVLHAGARGVVDHRAGPDALGQAIRTAARGEGVILDPERTGRLLAHVGLVDAGTSRPSEALTAREEEVLALLSRGATYESVAGRLGIRVGTVQSHVKSIYRKLSVDSKTAAAQAARARGLGLH